MPKQARVRTAEVRVCAIARAYAYVMGGGGVSMRGSGVGWEARGLMIGHHICRATCRSSSHWVASWTPWCFTLCPLLSRVAAISKPRSTFASSFGSHLAAVLAGRAGGARWGDVGVRAVGWGPRMCHSCVPALFLVYLV